MKIKLLLITVFGLSFAAEKEKTQYLTVPAAKIVLKVTNNNTNTNETIVPGDIVIQLEDTEKEEAAKNLTDQPVKTKKLVRFENKSK